MKRSSDRVYEVMKERLIAGYYAPGVQLREEPLAEEFGTSRTPVRAALRRLVDDGLASDSAAQGIQVAEWSDFDINETFQLRMLLEPHATRLACLNGGNALSVILEDANNRLASEIALPQGPNIDTVEGINRLFHRALLDHSGSPRLKTILTTMIEMPIVTRSFHLASRSDIAESLQHHQSIAKAVASADGELGHAAMLLHLRISFSRFMALRSDWQKTRAPKRGR